jgi:hypothetical protein
VAIAKEYGVHSAILLKNLHFWIQKNAANGRHYHDGTYWTYNSKKAFSELFPYLTERQVRTALERLITEGILITGEFNEQAFDHTTWYAITEKGYSILQKSPFDLTLKSNRTDLDVRAIPDINTDINTDISIIDADKPQREKKKFVPPSLADVATYCEERANGIDPELFVDFYERNGWKVGKNKMVDWKAAVRTWERRQKNEQKLRETPPRDAFLEFLDEEAAKARET